MPESCQAQVRESGQKHIIQPAKELINPILRDPMRKLIDDGIDTSNQKSEDGTGAWHYTEHKLIFCVPKSVDASKLTDDLWTKLKLFTLFNTGNTIANVTLGKKNGNTIAYFDSFGVRAIGSDIFNGRKVPVKITYDESRLTVHGRTLGHHMLVGNRIWKLEHLMLPDGNTGVVFTTAAYERPRGHINLIGSKIAAIDIGIPVVNLQRKVWRRKRKKRGRKGVGSRF